VLRLDGERMRRRRAHWQAIAVAACEQCGRACVPVVEPVRDFAEWLAPPAPGVLGWLLDPDREALAPAQARVGDAAVLALSGPEGGLTEAERRQALGGQRVAVRLGPRVLRADTAPLALLAWLAVGAA
jgi:16S rRNA (uracil1498-N3)-methyltransferase